MNIKRASVAITVGLGLPLLALLPAAAAAPAPEHSAKVVVSPGQAVETTDGNIAFVVEGAGFPSGMTVELNSPGLKTACVKGVSVHGKKVVADRNGRWNLPAAGTACVPGTYQVEATELTTPYRSFTSQLTIIAS